MRKEKTISEKVNELLTLKDRQWITKEILKVLEKRE